MKHYRMLVVSLLFIAFYLLAVSPTNVISQDATDSATLSPTESPDSAPDFLKYITQVMSETPLTVKSPDGRATLLIPPDALPSDTRIAQIKITPLSPSKAPLTTDKQRPLFAYQLEPDGLRFTKPALIQIQTALPAGSNTPILYTISGDTAELLTPTTADLDEKSKKLVVTAAVNHFSLVAGTGGWFSITVSHPGDHLIGVPFDVTAVVTLEPAGYNDVRNWTLRGLWNTYFDPGLNPKSVTNAPPTTMMSTTRTFTVNQTFVCKYAGFHTIRYQAILDVEYRNRYGPGTSTGKAFDTNTDSKSFRCVPLITKLTATFVPAQRTTRYKVTAYNPEGSTPLMYQWTNTNSCGKFTSTTTSPEAVWSHPHDNTAGSCPDEKFHPGTITVTVSDGAGISETIAYEGGSESGMVIPEVLDVDGTGNTGGAGGSGAAQPTPTVSPPK